MELWKDIKGFNIVYQVSNLGTVRSLRLVETVLKPYKKRYSRITLMKGKSKKVCSIHRLVAQAFIPNPKNKSSVNHKNGIKTDNRVENLEWVTAKENCQHAIKNKLRPNKYKK